MIAPALKRYALLVAALALSTGSALAEPPRLDALKMRNLPRTSTNLTTLSQNAAKEPSAPPAAAPTVDPAKVDNGVKEATAVLELCYELAHRSDPSLKAPVSVHATVHADGSLDLRAQAEALGNGYFSRCVERKLASIAPVAQLPEPSAEARLIVLGATPPTR